MHKLQKILATGLILTPILATIGWTVLPTLQVIRAVKTLPTLPFSPEDASNQEVHKQMQRTIQKHFRKQGIYIPTEDILTFTPARKNEALLMQKVCGRGTLFVWVPLKIRLPFIGERIKEWCFRVENKPS